MTTQQETVSGGAVREAYRDTVARLASVQKPSKGAPAYSRFVNRRAGRYLAAVAYRAGLTPNVVTAISAAFSVGAIAVLAIVRPSWQVAVAVCLGLVVGYAFDAADGQLARLRGGGSPSGEWLDHMVDSTKISALHLAVLISAYRFFGFEHPGWLLVPVGFTVVAAVMFFGMTLNDQLRRVAQATTGQAVARTSTSTLRSLLVVPTDYGVLCLVFLTLGWPHLFFAIYTALFAANLIFLLLAAVKWFRDMAALPSN
jgi:phosphatidylglycerophosphate synthase